MGLLRRKEVGKQDSMSLSAQQDAICDAWCDDHPFGGSYIIEVYDDHVIVCTGDEYWSVPYTMNGDEPQWSEAQATPVEQQWTEVAAMDFTVRKVDESKNLVFGWASVAVQKDGTVVEDSQGDLIDPADLEDAAYAFTLNYREGDEMHTEEVKAHLVESVVFTPEKLEKLGLPPASLPTGWWTGFYIPDNAVFAKVQDGTYAMFSIGGMAQREKAEEVA